MPFTQMGSVAPLPNPAMDRYWSSQEEPANQSLQRLPSVAESGMLPDIGMTPDEYLAHLDMSQSYGPPSRFNLSPNDAYAFQVPSACPSMISGSSAAEAASPLTRQSSSWGESATMARLASSQSQVDPCYESDSFSPAPNNNGKRPAGEQDLFGLGASLPPTAAQPYVSTGPAENSLLSSPDSSHMERSFSNASACSTKSTASNLERRAKEFRERVIQNAKSTTLAPKPQDSPKESTHSSSKKEPKVQLHKHNYQRPKHPKVFCDKCNEHPEGFRGDHELRRHVSAKHEGTVRKFVCRDPADAGLKSNVVAINPLSKCKACVGKKQYGAYYNAAAHLRRTHFKPKTPRGKSRRGADEKRGGKGGGDWPTMNDLKLWFEEITVSVDQSDSPEIEEDDLDEDIAEVGLSVNVPVEMLGIGNNMMFDIPANYEMTINGMDDSLLSVAGVPMSTPVSSASGSFSYSPYSDASPLTGLHNDYAFADQTMSAFSSNVSSSNTITPSTFNDMSQLSMSEPVWNGM